MKKLAIISTLALATFSGAVIANAQGGFQDPNAPQASYQKESHKYGKDGKEGKEGKSHKEGKHKEGKHEGKEHKGGFIDTTHPVSKSTEVSGMQDNQLVVLQGKLVKQVGKKDFLFRDASGEITVEIERKAWKGQEITPNDELKLYGEVDKSWNKTEIEIHRVEKLNSSN